MKPSRAWPHDFLVATLATLPFSIALGESMLALCLAAALIAVIAQRRRPVVPPVAYYLLAFVLVACVTAAIGLDPRASRKDLLPLLWLFVLPVAATWCVWPGRTRQALQGFAVGTGLLAGQILLVNPVKGWQEMQHSPARPGFLRALIHQGSMTDGQMLMLGVLVVLGLLWQTPRRARAWWGWLALLALELLALLVNFKRGSWFCACILCAAMLWVGRRRKWLLALGVAVLIVALLPPVRARLDELREEFDLSGGGRLLMWTRIAPSLIRQHPFGVGYGALSHELMKQVAPQVEPGRSHLHSNYFQILVETGWAGLAVYLLWMGKALRDGLLLRRRTREEPDGRGLVAAVLLLMLVGLLVNGLVEYNFGDSELLILYGIIMGLTAGALRQVRRAAG